MADISYRRKGDTGPLYNPERDYAYITPTLMRVAIEYLEVNEPKEKVEWRTKEQISSEEINAAVIALASAQRDFVNAADPVKTFAQALTRHDFYSCRYPVRQFLFAAIGEIFCAAWFTAVREVSAVGEESPAQTDMARFCATVREFVNREKGVTHDASFMVEHMRMYQDVLQAQIQQLLTELKARNVELIKCGEELRQQNVVPKSRKSFVARLLGFFRKTK
jgi:hypothetical protein